MAVFVLHLSVSVILAQPKMNASENTGDKIDLSGEWLFQIDSLDNGVHQQWWLTTLHDKIHLPGSMTTNGKGDEPTANTKWTGGLWNNAWFTDTAYEKYRQPGNVKISFWLQPVKYYAGVAWYQKKVKIPAGWRNHPVELFLERCHWETTVWIDRHKAGMQNALCAPDLFGLDYLTPGEHTITLRIDNRIKEINPGTDAHSVTDNTQTNWNGIIGKMVLIKKPVISFSDVQVFPDMDKKIVHVKIKLNNISGREVTCVLSLSVSGINLPPSASTHPIVSKNRAVQKDMTNLEIDYPMGDHPLPWDEFHPNLYSLHITISNMNGEDTRKIDFGIRKFAAQGQQLTINGRPIFLRGTLECAIFPKTGYPPTDTSSWMRIFRICRSYGLNHMRFHSWCPPEAAFEAADRSGFYLSIECSAWATVGDHKPIDQFLYEESNRIVNNFGNHPSFCMMPYGNEPGGDHLKEWLTAFVKYWKAKDGRRLYTTASGWPSIAENDYNSSPEPRIQHWDEGLKSIINREAPRSDYDWDSLLPTHSIPTISHEIGQWCVYPDFKEIPEYDGILKPKNFEIFWDKLKEHGMAHLADSFLFASGKLQVLCYKADIEAALRTPRFGGFQLLDLHDFPGQGTALVGVLNPFWEDKGYVTAKEYSRFCNTTVPLVRLPKMIYNNNEVLTTSVEIAHFGESSLKDITPKWTLKNASDSVLFWGELPRTNIPIGNGFKLGEIKQPLASLKQAGRFILTVTVGGYGNSWELFVYPDILPSIDKSIYVTQQLDAQAQGILDQGGKVLLTIKKGSVRLDKGGNAGIGFSSIFWNTSWTNGQLPHSLGILCNPQHPALKEFPTQYYSNWQWWDAMSHSDAIFMDAVSSNMAPIVRVIDDWFTARPLGLVFECKTGKGKLLVSGIDLLSDKEKRPEARQLLYSLEKYMAGDQFAPQLLVEAKTINELFK
jgi:Glycosyl hydrolases family 2, sugar binding domain/Glycosyl hydrolases family 2